VLQAPTLREDRCGGNGGPLRGSVDAAVQRMMPGGDGTLTSGPDAGRKNPTGGSCMVEIPE
jgi:hypothetical protein